MRTPTRHGSVPSVAVELRLATATPGGGGASDILGLLLRHLRLPQTDRKGEAALRRVAARGLHCRPRARPGPYQPVLGRSGRCPAGRNHLSGSHVIARESYRLLQGRNAGLVLRVCCSVANCVPKPLGPPTAPCRRAYPSAGRLWVSQQGRAHARRCVAVLPGYLPRSLRDRRMTGSSQPLLQVRGPDADWTRTRIALRARDSESARLRPARRDPVVGPGDAPRAVQKSQYRNF